MAKPICVLYIPNSYTMYNSGRKNDPSELMRILNGVDDNTSKPTLYWQDYYWFCFHKEGITEPEIQCFYEKDFTAVKFEELKKFIENHLNENTTLSTNTL